MLAVDCAEFSHHYTERFVEGSRGRLQLAVTRLSGPMLYFQFLDKSEFILIQMRNDAWEYTLFLILGVPSAVGIEVLERRSNRIARFIRPRLVMSGHQFQ